MSFAGYLIKNNTTNANANKFMQYDTYVSTPNQREEITAYRDDNTRNLTRITASGKKTKISFTTLPMDLATKQAFQSFFSSCMTNTDQRKVSITYWNDEDNTYKSAYFYLPDLSFKIKTITSNNIFYEPLEVNLIEY